MMVPEEGDSYSRGYGSVLHDQVSLFSIALIPWWSSASDLGGLWEAQPASNVDEIVGSDAESHPAPHAITAVIATASESVASLQHANASLTSGPPFLSLLEPALLFQFASHRTSCASVRHGTMFPSQSLHPFFLRLGVKTGIGGDQLRHASQLPPLRFHRRLQQMTVTRALLKHLIVGDDLVLGFLHLHQLAKLVGLSRLPLADNFRVWFEQADQLARQLSYPLEDPRLGLPHHPAHSLRHRFQPLTNPARPPPSSAWPAPNLLQHPSRISQDPVG